jgi:subtilase family serine protease
MSRFEKQSSLKAVSVVGVILSFGMFAFAQNPIAGTKGAAPEVGARPALTNAFVPEVSVMHPENAGLKANTNYVLFSANGAKPSAMASPAVSPETPSPLGFINEAETPASMGCIYKVGPTYAGCLPFGGSGHPTGGFGAIALVDAYNNPDAAADLAEFDSYFGLPSVSFSQIYCTSAAAAGGCYTNNTPPAGNTGWGLEEALDIEWAHVMAPSAAIYLVEAASNSFADLEYAQLWAGYYVDAAGGGSVSDSWGGGEFSTESSYDVNYYTYYTNTSYFASSGDGGAGVIYPSASPWVVAAGGTTVNRNSKTGKFSDEACWGGSGGGVSAYETAQGYQFNLVAGGARVVPDASFNADPNSGVYVYDKYNGGWFQVGGTSVSSPSLAGIVNQAGNKVGQGTPFAFQGFGYLQNQEDYLIYGELPTAVSYKKDWYDVTTGTSGNKAYSLYDECTGVGSPRGLLGK